MPEAPYILHIWPARWGLQSLDPTCLAAVMYLQLTIPGKFKVASCTNPDESPNGQLPFLTHGHTAVTTFPSMVAFVASLAKSSRASGAIDLDAPLTRAQKAKRTALYAHVERCISDIVSHMFYGIEANFRGLTSPALASEMPYPRKYYMASRIREAHRPRLEAMGLWSLPDPKEEQMSIFERDKKEKRSYKVTFERAFQRGKILDKVKIALGVYAGCLRGQRFFFGNRPTSLDVYFAAHILLLADTPFADAVLQIQLRELYPELVKHARHVQEETRRMPPYEPFTVSGSLLSSLAPRPFSTSGTRERVDPDDFRYRRRTLLFVLGTLAMTTAYIFTHVLFVDGPAEDSEDDNEDDESGGGGSDEGKKEEELAAGSGAFTDGDDGLCPYRASGVKDDQLEMIDDDLIVVDDAEEHHAGPSSAVNGVNRPSPLPQPQPQRTRPLRAAAEQAMATTLRLRGSPDVSERMTRFSSGKLNKPQPKLKLKLSERAAAQAPGMSFLGPYDRELDSDGEDLTFEEQFIIRMPHGEDCEQLRKMIQSREIGNDVWFKFKDSRRGIFHIGNSLYSFKLVDLPCIIEAQKTLDNKQMFKVADICQMLVVGDRIQNEEAVTANRNVSVDEFIWQHGITPPLHYVRKRRFRKRVNKRTIESVEEEVERLLAADNLASKVKYEVLDNVNPDLSDSEFIEREEPLEAPTPGPPGSEAGDIATLGLDAADEDPGEGEGEEAEPEGDIDEELAAELDLALGDEEEEGEGEDEDEEDEEDEDDDDSDEDEDDEDAQERKLLNEEIRDLEAAVAKKEHEVAISANPLIKKRFEDALKKLSADLEMKRAQRDEMKERYRRKKEGIAIEDPDTDAEVGPQDEVEAGDNTAQGDADLFGSDDPNAMDIG